MEPSMNKQESVIKNSELHKVTPFSKYLALVLFIILPFVGG
jgi:energy-coupling factor transporter transmembrane protein EcfT